MKAAKEQNLTEQRKQRIHALISDTNLANTYISNLIGETKGIQHQRRLLKASLDMLEAITNSSDGTFPTSYSELLGRLVQFNASVDQLTTNEQVKTIKKRTAKKLFIACLDLNFWKDKSNIDWATMEKHLSLSTLDMSNIYVEQIRCLCPTDRFARGILTFLHSKKVPKNYARTYVQVLKKIHSISQDFSNTAIRDGLQEFKSELISQPQKSANQYHCFQIALELFRYLKDHQIADPRLVLPKGLPKPANSSLTRKNNPTIISLSIHSLIGKDEILPTKEYLAHYHNALKKGLKSVLSQCRAHIRQAYTTFYEVNLQKDNESEKEKAIHSALNTIRESLDGRCFKYKLSEHEESLSITTDSLLVSNGMTQSLCGALMAIIIDELGINPWSLYHADVQAKGTNSSYVKLESDGTAVLKVTKWRQRRIQRKSTVPSSLTHPLELTDEKINASFCTQFALLARSQHAEQLKSNRLWLYETKTQLAELSGDGSHLFKSFREECLTEIEGIEAPTLMKIRSSRAIEKYLSTGGDVTAVAGYLGNKVKTALDTYIPLFLQEAIYRNKIHNFQNLYFVLATSSLEERLDVLKLTAQDYDNQVKRLINNEDFGGELFEVLCPPHKPLEQTFYFICSPENFAFALRYVSKNTYSEEDDNEMYLICKQALEKAGRAGVAIQRMLIQAQQLKVENR